MQLLASLIATAAMYAALLPDIGFLASSSSSEDTTTMKLFVDSMRMNFNQRPAKEKSSKGKKDKDAS